MNCIAIVLLAVSADPAWAPNFLEQPVVGVYGTPTAELKPDEKDKDQKLIVNDIQKQKGIFITEVRGLMASLGAEKYDVLLAIDGNRVTSLGELYAAIATLSPGKEARFLIAKHRNTNSGIEFTRKTVTGTVTSRRDTILANFTEDEDRVTGEKWVQFVKPGVLKDEAKSTYSYVSPYFQIKGGTAVNLRVKIGTVADRLLIPVAILLRAGDSLGKFPVNFGQVSTDIKVGGSSASVDLKVTDEMFDALTAIAVKGSGILRFEGRDAVRDVDIDAAAASQIADTLVAFKLRGGDTANTKMKWCEDMYKARAETIAKLVEGVELTPFSDAKTAEPKPAVPKVMTPEEKQAAQDAEKAQKQKAKETAAASKLKLAKPFIDRGDKSAAIKRLREIVENFGDTPSADDARKMLKKLEQ